MTGTPHILWWSIPGLALLTACVGARTVPGSALLDDRPSMPAALPADPLPDTGLSLALNLPAFRLDVWRGRQPVRTYDVAVGMRTHPTPRGHFAVTHIEWNPWWIPPDQPWARHERVTPPGPANPMGKVKLYFRPLYFLHGTPVASSLGSAASHGCVRMRDEDAIALALMLHAADATMVSAESLDLLVQHRAPTRVFALARPVPLAITYQLAEVRRDSLVLHPDIYDLGASGRVEDAMLALAQAGLDTTAARRTVLTRAVRAARRSRVAVSLDSAVAR